jgi:hypothetical protein
MGVAPYGGVTSIDLDVASDALVTTAVGRVIQRFGRLDVLPMSVKDLDSPASLTASRRSAARWTSPAVSDVGGLSRHHPSPILVTVARTRRAKVGCAQGTRAFEASR